MDIESIRDYCLSKKMVTESFPFGDTTLVFKVIDRMFALVNLDSESLSMNLKCDPEKAIDLREKYSSVLAGYHMNKIFWNTIIIDGSIPEKNIKEWIDHSYDEVVSRFSAKKKEQIKNRK